MTPLAARNGHLAPTDVSRDGRSLLLTNIGDQQEDVLISNTDLTDLLHVTDDVAKDRGPVFAPDGRILLYSNRDGDSAPWSIDQDGGGLQKMGAIKGISPSISPAGNRITVTSGDSHSGTPGTRRSAASGSSPMTSSRAPRAARPSNHEAP